MISFRGLLSHILLAYVSIIAVAQDCSSLLEKIEREGKAQEPQLRISRKEIREGACSLWWELGEHSGSAHIYFAASEKGATELLDKTRMRVPVGPKTKLQKLGDEGFLYQSSKDERGMILFRKASVFIHITGTSVSVAEKLAVSIAAHISSK
jgi:hypothetical protein